MDPFLLSIEANWSPLMKKRSNIAIISFLLFECALSSGSALASSVCGGGSVDVGHWSTRAHDYVITHCGCNGRINRLEDSSRPNPCHKHFTAKPVAFTSIPKKIRLPEPSPPTTISGKVKDGSTGKPLPGITVYPEGMKETLFSVTDSDGNYILRQVPQNVHEIYASAQAPSHYSEDNIVVDASTGPLKNQNLLLLPNLYLAQKIVIVLVWGEEPRDLDGHFVSPEGGEVYYEEEHGFVKAAVRLSNGSIKLESRPVALDVDAQQSFGPETTAISLNPSTEALAGGVYHYGVYNFAGSGNIKKSGAVVKVFFDGKVVNTFYPPKNEGRGKFWDVFQIEGNKITPVNKISSEKISYMESGIRK